MGYTPFPYYKPRQQQAKIREDTAKEQIQCKDPSSPTAIAAQKNHGEDTSSRYSSVAGNNTGDDSYGL